MPEKNKNKPKPKKEEVQPIYVIDPKDPRLLAYNDSLTLFKATEGDSLKFVKSTDAEWYKYASNFYNTPLGKAGAKAYKNLTKLNGKVPVGKRYGDINKDGGMEYKKPVQPVIYKKAEVKPKQKVIYKPGTTEAQAFNNSEAVTITPHNDYLNEPGGVFYTPPPVTATHATTPRMNKMPMRGMPSTQVNAEPIKVSTPKYQPPVYSNYFMDSRGEWSDVPQVPLKTDGTQYTTKELEKMGYRVSSKDSVPAKATTNKYDFGGLIDYNEVSSQRNSSIADVASSIGKSKGRNYKSDFFSKTKDALLFPVDNTLNAIGLGNVINSNTYSTKFGATTANNVSKSIGDVSKVVAPIVLSTMFGPAAGTAYSTGTSLIENNINPNQFKNGGMVNKEIINIEGSAKKEGDLATMKSKGELNVDLLGNIIQNYSAFNSHPAVGMDASSNVAVDTGTAVIPKKDSKAFRSANKAERQRMILSLVSKQKAKQGPIPKAANGHFAWQDILTQDNMQKDLSNVDNGDWADKLNKGLSLLSPMLKTTRGLFDQVENINPQEFAVKPDIKPALINDTASQMMINDSTNATLHNLRRLNTGPAALVNTGVNSMKQKWAAKQEIDRVNAASKMSTARANKQIELTNAGTALEIRDMNDMNMASKRNMFMEGANDLSKYGNQKQYDKAFFDTLPMMADNPQFNKWLEQQGYKKNKK